MVVVARQSGSSSRCVSLVAVLPRPPTTPVLPGSYTSDGPQLKSGPNAQDAGDCEALGDEQSVLVYCTWAVALN
ncbi:hypothetical protein E2C01_030207 [Portunus trituberculatus]|uniref:Uncharacterized protein n=1 Tax=Portunus trituberculatus TaxID=210409 RepID=A0A5B7EUQ8_PORTR|nr:hypothetical protein [Portunus trituberculatus]